MTPEELVAKKRHLLIDGNDSTLSIIFDPDRISPDGKFIEIGGFYSDNLKAGWYPIEQLARKVVSVIKVFEEEKMVALPRRWWQLPFH